MSQLDLLRGAYCPLIVPFSGGKIDFDTYGKLIERPDRGRDSRLASQRDERRADNVNRRGTRSTGRIRHQSVQWSPPGLCWDGFRIVRSNRRTHRPLGQSGRGFDPCCDTVLFGAATAWSGRLLRQIGNPYGETFSNLPHSRPYRFYPDG